MEQPARRVLTGISLGGAGEAFVTAVHGTLDALLSRSSGARWNCDGGIVLSERVRKMCSRRC